MSQAQLDDYEAFCETFRRHTSLDLAAYKRGQMERRIQFMAHQAGAPTLTQFWAKLKADPALLSTFVGRLTINVSEFYRNSEKYDELRSEILPDLLRSLRPLTIWSAGCSYGAEPYSLRMLLHELAPVRAHRILATDIDTGILERAVEARFTAEEVAGIPEPQRAQCLVRVGDNFEVAPFLRRSIHFSRHDLLRDPYPEQVDLIACRNVVIYFGDVARDHVHRHFYSALRPGGYLFIGNSERVWRSEEMGFVQRHPFIYQKPLEGKRP